MRRLTERLRLARSSNDAEARRRVGESPVAVARAPLALRVADDAHPVALGRLLHARATALHVVASVARIAEQHVLLITQMTASRK